MSKHTPEPWVIESIGLYAERRQIAAFSEDGNRILSVRVESASPREDEARIVACVNACKGASTEVLERGAVNDWALMMTELEAQRDELLEALQELFEIGQVFAGAIEAQDPNTIDFEQWAVKARAAIAEATRP